MKKITVRKFSWFRFVTALLILAYISHFVYTSLELYKEEKTISVISEPWFAPYVDVTAKPNYSFEQPGSNAKDVVLSFIVASKVDSCLPTWGTYHTLEDAAVQLDLDRRIARLRQQGGNISISFGGVINDELALKCFDEEKLFLAYKSVIDRYGLDTIDLDLENENLKDVESSIRRAKVVSKLQQEMGAQNKSLAIWLTLPVAPQGLTKEGTDAVRIMLENNVDLTGVNIMTMNYAESREDTQSMFEASRRALIETHRQLKILYSNVGLNLHDKTIWKKIGVTPMIGQNDIRDELFTHDDAAELNKFALETGIGRMSMWSANRDIACGENYVDIKIVSDSCSGVSDAKGTFTKVLSTGFKGTISQSSRDKTMDTTISQTVIDDPEKSPYQIWESNGVYPKGTKVVWRGNVYEAKWWTKNDVPDNPVLQYWETPWKLMGPVLPDEKPIEQLKLPVGTYPIWSGTQIYLGGDRVLFEGIPFQAKWWNQGESPAASASNPDSSPWLPLTQQQIEEILNEN